MITLATALFVLLGWCVLPGIAGAAVIKRRLSGELAVHSALAGGTVVGLSWWILSSELLARVAGLTMWSSIAAAIISTMLAAVVAVRGVQLKLAVPKYGTVPATMLAAVAAASPFVVQVFRRPDSLISPTSWYYWSLAKQLATSGRPPRVASEWGQEVPFLTDYSGFDASTASLAVLFGGDGQLLAAQVVRIAAAFLAALGICVLVRSMGASSVAALAAPFALISLTAIMTKLSSYRPEGFGYGLMLLTPATLRCALRADMSTSAGRMLFGITAAGFLSLSQVHAIAWVFCGTLIAGVIVGALICKPRDISIRQSVALLLLISTATLGGSVLLSGQSWQGGQLGGLPSIKDSQDPTYSFWLLAHSVPPPHADAPSPTTLASASLSEGLANGGPYVAFAAASTAALLLLLLARTPGAGRLFVFLLTAILLVVAVSAFFALGWETYVPRRTGVGRLFSLCALFPVAAAAVAASLPRRAVLRRALTVSWVLLAAGIWLNAWSLAGALQHSQPPQRALRMARDTRLPSTSIILANGYTEGILPVAYGAPGLLDGRAPYTNADLLAESNRLLLESLTFFADPVANQTFPVNEGVDYVLIAREPRSIARSSVMETDVEALMQLPNLRVIADNEYFVLLRVETT